MNGHRIGQDNTFAKPLPVAGGASYPCTPSSSQRGWKLTIVGPMDHKKEVTDFLRSRRDRITPEQAGIIGGGRRRGPGLRHEELAMLTVVGVEYYARMECGSLLGVVYA